MTTKRYTLSKEERLSWKRYIDLLFEKRNLIKRQVREAYRVRKYDLLEPLEAKNKGMLIAFLYLDKEIHPYAAMEKAMKKAIHILRDKE